MKQILVTGGAGFIGSHTVVELLKAGYAPIIMDNFLNSSPDIIEKIKKISGKDFKFYEADILKDECFDRIFKENKIEAVIHFAALKAVGESVEKPIMYYDNNIIGTIKLVEAMKKYNCNKIVFSSSATVYGMNNPVPYKENMPTSATNPYAYTKVMIEQILKDICTSDKDFSAMLLRYFNPIGAHESGLIGENPNGIPNNLLPYLSQVAVGKLKKLNVFGDDYDTPDGTGVRDYIHVVDLAKGHLSALKYMFENKGADAVNLGTGKGTSVLEIVKAFEKASGKKIDYAIASRRSGDIATCYADIEKAKKVFGWEAKFGIDKMCEDSWKFTQNNV